MDKTDNIFSIINKCTNGYGSRISSLSFKKSGKHSFLHKGNIKLCCIFTS